MTAKALPFLDLTVDGFSTRSAEVIAARDESWAAQTPYGLAVLRHRQAGMILRDRRFRQGSYHWSVRMGLEGSFARFWTQSVIGQEGSFHKAQRRLITGALSNDFVKSLNPSFKEAALTLIAPLKDKTQMEFMSEFSVPFAGRVNCALLGLEMENWQDVSHHASTLGLAMGPECKKHEHKFNASCDALTTLCQSLIKRARTTPEDQSYPARLTRAFDASELKDEQILVDLLVISIFGGVDTTKGQLGFLMELFSKYPEQWQNLRNDPNLADAAINEAIRHRPTTTWATREATEDLIFEGVDIPKGTTVHVLSHATGTDPARHDGQFDIAASRHIHFGFGGGAHHCLGHFLARNDMAIALNILAQHIETFSLLDAKYQPDSGNTSAISMHLKYQWAS